MPLPRRLTHHDLNHPPYPPYRRGRRGRRRGQLRSRCPPRRLRAPRQRDSGHASGSTVDSAPLVKGLYQSAYSERNNVLWATAAVGRPPVTNSSLLKVDPSTLKVEATYTPPVTNEETGAVEAVYGVAVDDEHNTVWTTNTRDNSVAVYSQRTGKHLASLPGVNHAREIVVDEKHDLVWASGFGDGTVVAFDTRTYKEKKRVTVEGAGPTGLAVNERTGAAYATDLKNDRIIEITPKGESPRLIPVGDGPISIALSKDGRTAYTADQAAGALSVVDLRSGAVTKTVPTGAGALSVATDRRSGQSWSPTGRPATSPSSTPARAPSSRPWPPAPTPTTSR